MNYPYISPKLLANLTDKSPIITHRFNFLKNCSILLKNELGWWRAPDKHPGDISSLINASPLALH